MSKKDTTKFQQFINKMNSKYRLVLINDDTLAEVANFKLNRTTVYTAASTIFILLVFLTVMVVVFTPLKYYIPGYDSGSNRKELLKLKLRVDSLQDVIVDNQNFIGDFKKTINGDWNGVVDTNTLTIKNGATNATNDLGTLIDSINK